MDKQKEYLPGNRLLDKLKSEEIEALSDHLELLDLELRQVSYEANAPIDYCYFPISGVISIVAGMHDGSVIEVATVGKEGMVGLPLIFGAESSSTRAFCQIAGKAWRISAANFCHAMDTNTNFSRIVRRYAQAMFDLVTQTSACNRFHTIEQRFSRWLLFLHDRTKPGNSFFITQEFLAEMLGVQRSGVNLAAGLLQKSQLISYVRGKVTVLNRAGLESASCECYRASCNIISKLHEDGDSSSTSP